MGWEAWAKRSSQSNMRGATRATTRRCSLLVLAPRSSCARTSPGSVIRWSGENPGWLLILDNADTQEAASGVEETLPRFRGGQVIITSRIADWSPAVQTAEPLNVLDETEAAAFLLERTEAKRRRTLADFRRRWRWRARWRAGLGAGTSGRLRRQKRPIFFGIPAALGVA